MFKTMRTPFIDFWRKYAPDKQYHNRYRACEHLWNTMAEQDCACIMGELETSHPSKNPYFYLLDWEPTQPQWLAPKEVTRLLQQGIPLAVCRNPKTQLFGTVTKAEAERHALQIHHCM